MARPPLDEDKFGLLQGTLDMLILQTLRPGPAHGHQIATTIERTSHDVLQVDHGSLYPALHRLIKRGWISGTWGTSTNNRRAKFYSLTRRAAGNWFGNRTGGSGWSRQSRASCSRRTRRNERGSLMTWPPWLCRLLPYLRRRQAEEDLHEELRLHLELERARQRDAGVPESNVLRAARRTLGNTVLIRERTRDVWGWRWLDDLARDVRHALRGLGRSRGFAATVVLVLALGIGANTAMFSVVYGMLIRPLPYPDAGAIVRITESRGPTMLPYFTSVSMAAILEEAGSFEHIAGYAPSSVSWRAREGAVTLRAARVSPSIFPLLRATPQLGRLFTEEEAREGADRVVLLSHGAWTRRFGSDPDIVGSVIDLDSTPHTVVGVLAEGFFFPSPEEEVWTPYVLPGYTITLTNLEDRRGLSFSLSFVTALGRLRPGVSTEQAATEVRTILQRRGLDAQLRAAPGSRFTADRPEIDARVVSLQEEMVRGYRPALLALTAATALVLLIACTNVAGLLLARG